MEVGVGRVVAFLSAKKGSYCADCLRARLSLGRGGMTANKLGKLAAEDARLVREHGKCACCRRSLTVLRASADANADAQG